MVAGRVGYQRHLGSFHCAKLQLGGALDLRLLPDPEVGDCRPLLEPLEDREPAEIEANPIPTGEEEISSHDISFLRSTADQAPAPVKDQEIRPER